jgi:uncharacterized repeat protein (TIGR01451 family)
MKVSQKYQKTQSHQMGWRLYLHKAIRYCFPLTSVLILIKTATAYQIPTTTNGVWGGTGTTTAATKTTPSGLRMTVSLSGAGMTFGSRNNITLQTANTITVPALPAATNGIQVLATAQPGCDNTSLTCTNLGTLNFSFTDPSGNQVKVKNPTIHMSRLGGSLSSTTGGVTSSFYLGATLNLTTPGLTLGSPASGSRGFIVNTGNQIAPNLSSFPTTAATGTNIGDCTASPANPQAGCGSIAVTGTTSSLAFDIGMLRNNTSLGWSVTNSTTGAVTTAADGIYFTASFDEDYGDAPASYDVSSAASHIVSDLTLGSTITADNSTTANGGATGTPIVGTSPKAVAAGANNNSPNGDSSSDDGVTSFPALTTTASGTSYTVPVNLSGVSNAGQVCGWIDYNKNGTFDNTTERACTNFVSGATSVNLTWAVPAGLTTGSTYARIRASYDKTALLNPTGQLSSGEVEDYQLSISSSISISGKVWDDADGSITQNSETGAVPSGLFVYAVDSNGLVVDVASVPTNGTAYTLTNIPGNASYILRLSTDGSKAIGQLAPAAASLPNNWVNTGENKNGVTETAMPGEIALNVTTANIINMDFGIEQLPNTTALSLSPQSNPGGVAQVPVPPLAGLDPEEGALGSGKSFKIISLPINGDLYYNGTKLITQNFIISNYDPTELTLDPNDGAITVDFTYAAIDSAGKEDPTPATVTMPFTVSTVTQPPKILLVKRITAINGNRISNPNDNTPLNLTVDDAVLGIANDTPSDTDPNWPLPSSGTPAISEFLTGAVNAGKLNPGDTIEYTIYFLNTGGTNAKDVRICDRILGNQVFLPAAYGAGNDIQVQIGNGSITGLTQLDDTVDRGTRLPSNTPPSNCNLQAVPAGVADNGTIAVQITGTGHSGQPDLAEISNSTAPGTPGSSYGFIRFTTKVETSP